MSYFQWLALWVLLIAVAIKVWQIADYLHMPCGRLFWGCI